MIRGPSGGGKTTLLNMIGTIDLPTTGTIELMGEKIRWPPAFSSQQQPCDMA